MFESVLRSLPKGPGSYLLWLYLPQSQDLTVGRLGTFAFPAGDYIYLGSAHGPGGLQARLGRHLRGSGRLHWHIDYLRAVAQPHGFSYETGILQSAPHVFSRECNWSQRLAALPETHCPAPGFGASDCHAGCAAHLVHFHQDTLRTPERFTNQIPTSLRIIENMVYLPSISKNRGRKYATNE